MRKLEQPGDEARVLVATSAANAGCHAPTHLFERDGVVVGYASIGAIPFLTGWFSDTAVSQPEANECMAAVEQVAAANGAKLVVLPCVENCRMREDLPAMGYRNTGRVELFLKPITQ